MDRTKFSLLLILTGIAGLVWYLADDTQVVAKFDGTPPSTPAEVEQLPEGANFGYEPDAERTQEFLQAMPGGKATLREQAPELFVGDNKESVVLYPALYIAYEQRYPGSKWVVGKQGIGDCVSWGWAHGADIHLAVLKRLGLVSEWKPAATEAIYGGSRVEARGRTSGGWSDGSYGAAAAKWVRDWGVVFREDYSDRAGSGANCTTYDAAKAKQWGNYGAGGRDDNGRLDRIAKEHPIKTVALVTTWDETVAAIENGYPIPVCSGQGFSSTRDKDGFCRASGSWAHCMVALGVRHDREGVLILNSWGPNWVNGPKWPTGEGYSPGHPRGPPPAMPDGSFWCERRTWERMIAGRDSFAVSGFEGFPKRRLKNSEGW